MNHASRLFCVLVFITGFQSLVAQVPTEIAVKTIEFTRREMLNAYHTSPMLSLNNGTFLFPDLEDPTKLICYGADLSVKYTISNYRSGKYIDKLYNLGNNAVVCSFNSDDDKYFIDLIDLTTKQKKKTVSFDCKALAQALAGFAQPWSNVSIYESPDGSRIMAVVHDSKEKQFVVMVYDEELNKVNSVTFTMNREKKEKMDEFSFLVTDKGTIISSRLPGERTVEAILLKFVATGNQVKEMSVPLRTSVEKAKLRDVAIILDPADRLAVIAAITAKDDYYGTEVTYIDMDGGNYDIVKKIEDNWTTLATQFEAETRTGFPTIAGAYFDRGLLVVMVDRSYMQQQSNSANISVVRGSMYMASYDVERGKLYGKVVPKKQYGVIIVPAYRIGPITITGTPIPDQSTPIMFGYLESETPTIRFAWLNVEKVGLFKLKYAMDYVKLNAETGVFSRRKVVTANIKNPFEEAFPLARQSQFISPDNLVFMVTYKGKYQLVSLRLP
jgi:hypothetical protein